MNRRIRKELSTIRDALSNIIDIVDEFDRETLPQPEEPTAEEVEEMANWTAADEEAKEGPYLNAVSYTHLTLPTILLV